MVAFFGGVSKASLSIIVMGSEMTGGYTLLAPMMLATFISYTLSGEKNTIYRERVSTPQDSPVHKTEFQVPVLRKLLVRDAMNSLSYNKVEENATIEEALRGMQQSDSPMVSVVDNDGNLLGVVYLSDLLGIPPRNSTQDNSWICHG